MRDSVLSPRTFYRFSLNEKQSTKQIYEISETSKKSAKNCGFLRKKHVQNPKKITITKFSDVSLGAARSIISKSADFPSKFRTYGFDKSSYQTQNHHPKSDRFPAER